LSRPKKYIQLFLRNPKADFERIRRGIFFKSFESPKNTLQLSFENPRADFERFCRKLFFKGFLSRPKKYIQLFLRNPKADFERIRRGIFFKSFESPKNTLQLFFENPRADFERFCRKKDVSFRDFEWLEKTHLVFSPKSKSGFRKNSWENVSQGLRVAPRNTLRSFLRNPKADFEKIRRNTFFKGLESPKKHNFKFSSKSKGGF
jgi:hypothetical protein